MIFQLQGKILLDFSALSAGAVEYADCTSAEGYLPPPPPNKASCWPWVATCNA